MTLRTPRRRISPRTKHRYRVIRNFFRKALGSTQSEIKISSSIAINVTDFKRKIIGLEHKLSEVSKHYQELTGSESISSKKSYNFIPVELEKDLETLNSQRVGSSKNKLDAAETKVLYKPPEIKFKESAQGDTTRKSSNNISGSQPIRVNSEYTNNYSTKIKKKKRKLNNFTENLHKRKTVSACENSRSIYSTSSFHTAVDSRMAHCFNDNDDYVTRHHPKLFSAQYIDAAPNYKNEFYRAKTNINSTDTKPKRNNRFTHHLDEDFIADIIKRQYKPIKMFGRRESDVSQFSAPVCRDQEYSVRENIQVDPELCSCCYDKHPQNINKHHKLKKMRSVCDTRLYSAKKYPRTKHRRRQLDAYNDSEFYDLIPVKEKTSPKSRRKFVADTMMAYDYYREVPPSPRTLRPRLNLTAQYYAEYDDYMARKRLNTKCSSTKLRRTQEHGEYFESDGLYETGKEGNVVKDKIIHQNKIHIQKQKQTQQHNGTESNLHEPNFVNIQNVTADTPLNKTQETDLSIDRTDKALFEIKDILQNFLQEIKKEATASQCDKSDVTSKAAGVGTINHKQNASASIKPNSGQSFNNYTMAHCGVPSFITPFSNPCCYPILPVCPMNCMQNGYIVPNSSISCAKCANNKDTNEQPVNTNNNSLELHTPENEELIKKIYKYVTQSPRDKKKECDFADKRKETKLLTSRSVGGSTKAFKHDVKVGTPTMKYYSKSCEAIGSRMLSDAYYSTTNPTYSDTILEKLSLEVTPTDTISETDCTANTTSGEKSKKKRLTKILQSFGIKKKKDVIEELSESDSTIEVEVKNKPQPFRQEVTNYMMNNEEYYHPPPIPPIHTYQQRRHEYQEYHVPYPSGGYHKPGPEIHNPHSVHQQTIHEHKHLYNRSLPVPSAPPYSQSFDSYIPSPQNIPLCLKEIEVKSVGTQSDRRMSFFQKMRTKIQVPTQSARSEDNPQKNCSTQTSQNKPGLFNWKNIENKPNKDANPMTFSYLKQKQLAQGDLKMRSAMMKRLFYKKNPFSPGNLLVRTLMGKDKSSFGDPPVMYKPKMFF